MAIQPLLPPVSPPQYRALSHVARGSLRSAPQRFVQVLGFLLQRPVPRVLLLASVMLLGLLILGVHRARAKTAEALSLLGEQAMQIPAESHANRSRQIELNGFHLRFQTGSSNQNAEEVISQFASACRERAGMNSGDLLPPGVQTPQQIVPVKKSSDALLDGVFEKKTKRGFVVACFDTGDTQWLSKRMLERLHRFAETGDIGEIGTFRYALIKPTKYGAHFIKMWTEQGAPLLRMFPAKGDAPGIDHTRIPRPPNSRRLLSMNTEGLQVVVFSSPTTPLSNLVKHYESVLNRADVPHQELAPSKRSTRLRVGGSSESYITFTQLEHEVLTSIADVPP